MGFCPSVCEIAVCVCVPQALDDGLALLHARVWVVYGCVLIKGDIIYMCGRVKQQLLQRDVAVVLRRKGNVSAAHALAL